MNPPKSRSQVKKSLEIFPYFLVTIPTFLITHIENEYRHLINYEFVIREILELLLIPFTITGFLFLFTRNFHRAAIYTLPVVLIFYFFCDLKDSLHYWSSQLLFTSYTFLLPLCGIILLVIFRAIRKSNSDFRKIFLFVNVTFLAFVLIELFDLAIDNFAMANATGNNRIQAKEYIPCDTCVRPDIYYLVFDAYTSSATLKSDFGYDNSSLDSFLVQKNFTLVRNSSSNYNLTPFSISSIVNFDYYPSRNLRKEFYLHDYLSAVSLVYSNELRRILKKEGYEIFNHSIFDFEDNPSTVPPFDVWEVVKLYRRHNILKKIKDDIGWVFSRYLPATNTEDDYVRYGVERDKHSNRTIAALRKTIHLNTSAPKFVYGHLLIPHEPYTYDSLGKKVQNPGKPADLSSDKQAYTGQLIYTNKVITSIVESIFLHGKKPFIVILQGDHGYRHEGLTNKNLEFSNLNAFYFYNHDYRFLYDSMSNVNTFRGILNTFFKKNYPLLKDTSYFLQYK